MELERYLKEIKDAELDIELLKRENEKLCEPNVIKIAKLTSKIGTSEEELEKDFKKTKEDKIECKLGSVSWRKTQDEWKYKDEILMAWIISLPARFKDLFLKVTTTIKRAELKKQIMLDNDALFEKSKLVDVPTDIELFLLNEDIPPSPYRVEGIEVIPRDPVFSYTIKKKK